MRPASCRSSSQCLRHLLALCLDLNRLHPQFCQNVGMPCPQRLLEDHPWSRLHCAPRTGMPWHATATATTFPTATFLQLVVLANRWQSTAHRRLASSLQTDHSRFLWLSGSHLQWLLQLQPLVRLARKTNQSLKCLCADVLCHSQQQCSQCARKGRTPAASFTNVENAIFFSGQVPPQVGVVAVEICQ